MSDLPPFALDATYSLVPTEDPREAGVEWLTSPENIYIIFVTAIEVHPDDIETVDHTTVFGAYKQMANANRYARKKCKDINDSIRKDVEKVLEHYVLDKEGKSVQFDLGVSEDELSGKVQIESDDGGHEWADMNLDDEERQRLHRCLRVALGIDRDGASGIAWTTKKGKKKDGRRIYEVGRDWVVDDGCGIDLPRRKTFIEVQELPIKDGSQPE